MRRAIAENDLDAGTWCNLGSVLAAQDRLDEAIVAFRRAREIELSGGGDARCLANYGATLLGFGRAAEAHALNFKFKAHERVQIRAFHHDVAARSAWRFARHFQLRAQRRKNFLRKKRHLALVEGVPKVVLTKCRFIDELRDFHFTPPKRVFAPLLGKSDFIQFWRSSRDAMHI